MIFVSIIGKLESDPLNLVAHMQVKFAASQRVSIAVPQEEIPIRHYLRQPYRLIQALADETQVEQLAPDCFRLKMRSRQFMMLTIQPTVDIKIWSESDGSVHLKAINCELQGADYINQRFQLTLDGVLQPIQKKSETRLEGIADLAVEVELPPMLWMTPKPILSTTGNGLLKSILMTVKQRLVQQIVLDYQVWCETVSQTSEDAAITPALSPIQVFSKPRFR